MNHSLKKLSPLINLKLKKLAKLSVKSKKKNRFLNIYSAPSHIVNVSLFSSYDFSYDFGILWTYFRGKYHSIVAAEAEQVSSLQQINTGFSVGEKLRISRGMCQLQVI